MSRYALTVVAVLVCLSCKQQAPQQQTKKSAAAGPQTRATVVTIRTTVTPGDKTLNQTLVIANDRARNTSEIDAWRLFDTKAETITFVDDVAKTIRIEKMDDAAKRHRAALAGAIPPHYPRLRASRTGTKKPLQGVSAEQFVVQHGGYKRELWVAEHPSIPRGLFAMMQASERPASPLAPMMRGVDEALLATRGFPLVDRTEVAYGNQKMVIERAVVSIEQRDVAEAALAAPRGYEDVTPKPPAPAKKKKK
jgi:hypothetical protein